MLEATNTPVVVEAAFAATSLAEGHPPAQRALLHAGICTRLLQAMAPGPSAMAWAAMLCMLHCCEDKYMADAVAAADGVAVLAAMLHGQQEEDTLVMTLRVLCAVTEGRVGNCEALAASGWFRVVVEQVHGVEGM